MIENLRITIDQLTYSRVYLKFFRDAFFVNYLVLWINFCQNTNVVFTKVTGHYFLLAVLEKWKSPVDKGKSFGVFLTDQFKVFYCLFQKLLIAKLRAYRFSIAALRLIHSYLTNRWQITKVNVSYSSLEEIVFWYHKGLFWDLCCSTFFLCDRFSIT